MRLAHENENTLMPTEWTWHDNYQLVEFDPQWLNADGLPVNMNDFVLATLPINGQARGVRWADRHPHMFHIERKAETAFKQDDWTASFDMDAQRVMIVTADKVEIHSRVKNRSEMLIRYTRGIDAVSGETVWVKQAERRLFKQDHYGIVPTRLAAAMGQMDRMIRELTELEQRVTFSMAALELRHPNYVKPVRPYFQMVDQRKTSDEAAEVYKAVYEFYSKFKNTIPLVGNPDHMPPWRFYHPEELFAKAETVLREALERVHPTGVMPAPQIFLEDEPYRLRLKLSGQTIFNGEKELITLPKAGAAKMHQLYRALIDGDGAWLAYPPLETDQKWTLKLGDPLQDKKTIVIGDLSEEKARELHSILIRRRAGEPGAPA